MLYGGSDLKWSCE